MKMFQNKNASSILIVLIVIISFVFITTMSNGFRIYDLEKLADEVTEDIAHIKSDNTATALQKELKETRQELKEVQEDYLQLYNMYTQLKEHLDISISRTLENYPRVPLVAGWKWSRGTVTAYSPFDNVSGIESDGDPTNTSTGSYPSIGTFAVNPRVIPYGSEVVIAYEDGTIEYGIAKDTGGTMLSSSTLWVDVYRDTYAQTLAFGKRVATVYWKEPINEAYK